ncbi:MAG TPA: alpha/beta hydrolase [Xanthobacteraceae bacterium]|nr:alpha/beta hydrolase [Xanthobacteraceae bacterium]
MTATVRHAATSVLDIVYEDSGPGNGEPVFLMHGWPYGPRVYDAVVPRLIDAGCRTIVPYLRGFGPTRFLSPGTPRSGQQAALGDDLRQLMDALDIKQAVLVGYDWGGRASCVAAALWPERVRALVTGDGYNIHNVANSATPAAPEQELRQWYQYYFHLERGRAGLAANRREICRLLWRLWSPNWEFSEEIFAQTATAWDNPDFVDVTIHSYRVRYGNAADDPALIPLEQALGEQPAISVPTIVLHGDANGIAPAMSDGQRRQFLDLIDERRIPRAGHNLPSEAPDVVADAVLALLKTLG